MTILLSMLLFMITPSFSQDFFSFIAPESPSTSIDIEGIYLPNSDLDSGKGSTEVVNSALTVNQKVFDNQKNMVTVGARYQKLDQTSDSSRLVDYFNHQGSLTYKQELSDQKFWLSSVSYGSASDRPFKNNRDNILTANYIQKMNSKWFIAANYSNNRSFLNNVPLPGFFYVHEMTREKSLVLGFPFFLFTRSLTQNWTLRYLAVMPWTHRLRVYYTRWRIAQPYIGYEQSPQNYFRHDRQKSSDRFFWFERRVSLGLEGRLSRFSKWDLSGGWAFERKFFEAENFSDNKNFLINIEDAYFLALNTRIAF